MVLAILPRWIPLAHVLIYALSFGVFVCMFGVFAKEAKAQAVAKNSKEANNNNNEEEANEEQANEKEVREVYVLRDAQPPASSKMFFNSQQNSAEQYSATQVSSPLLRHGYAGAGVAFGALMIQRPLWLLSPESVVGKSFVRGRARVYLVGGNWSLGIALAGYGVYRLLEPGRLSKSVFSMVEGEENLLASGSRREDFSVPPEPNGTPFPPLIATQKDTELPSKMDSLEYMHEVEEVSVDMDLDDLLNRETLTHIHYEDSLKDSESDYFPTPLAVYFYELSSMLAELSGEISHLEIELHNIASESFITHRPFVHLFRQQLGGRGVMSFAEWQSLRFVLPLEAGDKTRDIVLETQGFSQISLESLGFKFLKLSRNATLFISQTRAKSLGASVRLLQIVSRLSELFEESGKHLMNLQDRLSVHKEHMGEYVLSNMFVELPKHLVSTDGVVFMDSLSQLILRVSAYMSDISEELSKEPLMLPKSSGLSYIYSKADTRLDLALVLARRQLQFARDQLTQSTFFNHELVQQNLSEGEKKDYLQTFDGLVQDLVHVPLHKVSENMASSTKLRFGSPFALRLLRAYTSLSQLLDRRGIDEERAKELMDSWDRSSSLSRVRYIQTVAPPEKREIRLKWWLASHLLRSEVFARYQAAAENLRLISKLSGNLASETKTHVLDKRKAFLFFDQANYEFEELDLAAFYGRFQKQKTAMGYFFVYYKYQQNHVNSPTSRKDAFRDYTDLSVLLNLYPSVIMMEQISQVLLSSQIH